MSVRSSSPSRRSRATDPRVRTPACGPSRFPELRALDRHVSEPELVDDTRRRRFLDEHVGVLGQANAGGQHLHGCDKSSGHVAPCLRVGRLPEDRCARTSRSLLGGNAAENRKTRPDAATDSILITSAPSAPRYNVAYGAAPERPEVDDPQGRRTGSVISGRPGSPCPWAAQTTRVPPARTGAGRGLAAGRCRQAPRWARERWASAFGLFDEETDAGGKWGEARQGPAVANRRPLGMRKALTQLPPAPRRHGHQRGRLYVGVVEALGAPAPPPTEAHAACRPTPPPRSIGAEVLPVLPGEGR